MEESTLVKSLSVVFCFFRGDIACVASCAEVTRAVYDTHLRHEFTTRVAHATNRPSS